MQSADLQVIKDIPGYKVILKAVLKSQIQQLVQQLEEDIGEDFLLLSASVSEGSLSHLGSESGKVFLEDHDDIKAQFLAFCLKRQHTLKQIEKEREQQTASDPERLVPGPKPRYTPTKPHTSPRQLSSLSQSPSRAHSVKVTHAPRSNTQRGGASNVRHEPYPGARPRKKAEHSDSVSNLKETIKIEVNDDVDHANRSNNGNEMHSENEKTNSSIDLNSLGPFSDLSSQTDITTEISQSMVGDNSSESSSSTIINKSLHADSKRMDDSVSENIEGASTLASMNIKVETNAEYDSDLEIPGVESGDMAQNATGVLQSDSLSVYRGSTDMSDIGMQQNLRKTVTKNLRATNLLPDKTQVNQNSPIYMGYTGERQKRRGRPPGPSKSSCLITQGQGTQLRYACTACGKRFTRPSHVEIHQRIHTGHRPYKCQICDYSCAQQGNLKYHMRTHIEQK